MNELGPWLLCLQDPSDRLNDLGRLSFAFLDVQAVFRFLYEHTTNYIENPGSTPGDIGPLGSFLGSSLNSVRDRRVQFEQAYSSEGSRDLLQFPQTKTTSELLAIRNRADAT